MIVRSAMFSRRACGSIFVLAGSWASWSSWPYVLSSLKWGVCSGGEWSSVFTPDLGVSGSFPKVGSVNYLLSSEFSSVLFSFFSVPVGIPILGKR